MKFILAALGLVIGNFLMNEYAIALERSYFQCIAIFTMWLFGLFWDRKE